MIRLVLGGARSGKSELAEAIALRLAVGAPPGARAVTYLATATVADEDMARRVDIHRARRPLEWITAEAPGPALVPALAAAAPGVVIIESLGTWVAGWTGFEADTEGLCSAALARSQDVIIVGEEVGLGVHPTSAAGRVFRDHLGELNRRVAEVAGQVLLAVAGRAIPLPPPGTGDLLA